MTCSVQWLQCVRVQTETAGQLTADEKVRLDQVVDAFLDGTAGDIETFRQRRDRARAPVVAVGKHRRKQVAISEAKRRHPSGS